MPKKNILKKCNFLLIITNKYLYLHITNSQTQKINNMKTTKSLTRNQCLDALIGLNDKTGIAREIHIFANDKYFWDKYRRFTSERFIDLLIRLHKQGRWQSDFEKNVFNEYLNKLQN